MTIAYIAAFLMIGLLALLARRNRLQGWRRPERLAPSIEVEGGDCLASGFLPPALVSRHLSIELAHLSKALELAMFARQNVPPAPAAPAAPLAPAAAPQDVAVTLGPPPDALVLQLRNLSDALARSTPRRPAMQPTSTPMRKS